MAPTPDQIRHDIDRTRAELVADANRLVDHTSPRRIAERRVRGVRHRLTRMRETVMGTASDTSSTMQDRAQEATHAVADRTQEAAQAVAGRAQQAAEAVQSAPQQAMRQTQGNPLAAGVIAFGAGLLAATLIPRTRTEEQAVRQLGESTSGLAQPMKEAATESLQTLKEEASDVMSSTAGEMKETASQAAQTTAQQAKEHAQGVAGHARESGRMS
ncbi:DUF3618 domain-containing protein [Actinosynnema sp. CS-041913]|uniref:DUF3618 domain-containing protein n=1 Tax=Actinosynnema sp. CS-041913 TaxID=3239917 RepID=UPI003D9399FC